MAPKPSTIWTPLERSAWRPPPDITVSEWADSNRMIAGAAETGPWETSRTPYLRDIMDAYTDPEVEVITITGPAQCGKTEAVFNMIGYTIDCDPMPCLYVTNTEDNSRYISTDRIKPMCEESPALARHMTGRPWDFEKGKQLTLDRMSLYFGSAQSISTLVSKAIGRLFCDETDKWKFFVGREGNPAQMAGRRGTTYGDFKVVYLCTLTDENGFIYVSYNLSNMCQNYTPCPRCGEFIRMRFSIETLKVDPPKLRDPEIIRRDECVYYKCQVCGGRIEQYEKSDMVDNGKWCPEGQHVTPEGKLIGRPKRSRRHVGYWINEMISPWLHWHKMLAEWFEKNTPEGIALGLLKEFKNQVLVQVWTEEAIDVDSTKLSEHVGDFSQHTVPSDCKVLVCGADYHKGHAGNIHIDYEVRGFGYNYRNWVISSGSLTSWEAFENDVLFAPYRWSDPDKAEPELTVVICFIDSGFLSPDVYDFCLRHPGLCFPTKGKDYQRAPIVTSALEKTAHKRYQKRGLLLYWIDTYHFKNQVTGWADAAAGDIRQTSYYAEIPQVYFNEFTNEHRVKVRDKTAGQVRYVWRLVAKGRRNHFLDTAVLAAAAAYHIGVYRMRPKSKMRVKLSEKLKAKREGR